MMLSCIAAVAIATVVGKKTFESHAYETNSLLLQNVEALSNPSDGDGNTYRYPNKQGKAKFCKLYVYMKAGAVVSTGTTENPTYEGKAEYEKKTIEGLKDKCPDNGSGCNPYSCQEVAY